MIRICRVIKLTIILFILVLVILFSQEYYFRNYDHNAARMDGFYLEAPNTIDVAFIGASEIYSGFSSVQAYKEFGYTSYPLATDAASVTLWKYEIQELLKRQSPKIIVIEINGILGNSLYNDKNDFDNYDAVIRRVLDNSPFSINKVEAILNCGEEETFSYLIPFIKYHGNWKDVVSCSNNIKSIKLMKQRGYSVLKGITTKSNIFVPEETIDIKENICLNNDLKNEYIAFLQYCKLNNIKNIVFTSFPHIITSKNQLKYSRICEVKSICKEYGYDFIEFDWQGKDIGIDVNMDFYNEEHMNIYGQKKFTKVLSNVLVNKYNVRKSILDKDTINNWQQSVKYYDKFYVYVDKLIKCNNQQLVSENYNIIKMLDKN